MNRIKDLFNKKGDHILSVYFTAGFPQLSDTVKIATALAEAGADIIEIGIPFSDPVADGPTIQASNKIALDNGMNVKILLEQVKEIREKISIPIMLMGYLNPVMQYGVERFARDAAQAGADGTIIPDLPMDEYIEMYKHTFDQAGLCNTFLISPTTSEARIKKIDDATDGFIYAVSSSSTTGAKADFSSDHEAYFKRLKNMRLKNNLLIGFGISNQDTFSVACKYAAGAIVGSAFINMIKDSSSLTEDVKNFIQAIKSGE